MDMGGKNGHIRVPTYQQQQQVRKRQQDFLRTANDNADERAAPLQSSCASTVHAQSPSVSCAASFDQWQPLQPSYASTAHAHIPAAPLAKWNSGKRSSDTTAEARAEALHAEALHAEALRAQAFAEAYAEAGTKAHADANSRSAARAEARDLCKLMQDLNLVLTSLPPEAPYLQQLVDSMQAASCRVLHLLQIAAPSSSAAAPPPINASPDDMTVPAACSSPSTGSSKPL